MSQGIAAVQEVLLPPVEKPARLPAWVAGVLAAGQTGWLLTHLAPRFEEFAPAAWTPGRVIVMAVAPEVAAYLAGVAVWLVFALARRLGGAWAGVLAAALFVAARAAGAGGAGAVDMGVGLATTQTVVMVLLLAGAWRALRFADDPSVVNGLAAGVLLGALPAFSRTGTIGGLAIVAWVVWQMRPHWRSWPLAVGLGVPLAWIVSLRGAELVAAWAGFFRVAGQTIGRAWAEGGAGWMRLVDARGALWLMVAVLGVAGAVALVVNWRQRAEGVLLAGVAGAMIAFLWLARGPLWPGQFWILPVPFLLVAGACLIARTAERGASGARLAVGGVVVAQLALGGAVWSQHAAQVRRATVTQASVRAFAEKNIAAGGFVIGWPSSVGGMQPGGRWRLVDARLLSAFPPGGGDAMEGRMPRAPRGPGTPRGGERERLDQVWHALQARAQGGPVYWFTRSTASVDRALHGRAGYEVVGEVEAPVAARAPGVLRAEPPGTLKVVRIVFPAR